VLLQLAVQMGYCAEPAWAQSEATAKRQIGAQYARIIAAVEASQFDHLRDILAADYTTVDAHRGESDLGAFLTHRSAGSERTKDRKFSIDIEQLVVHGDSAIVTVRTLETGYNTFGPAKFAVRLEETVRDEWARRSGSWRLIRTATEKSRIWVDDVLFSHAEIAPPLSPQQRRELLAELRTRAVPFDTVAATDAVSDLAGLDRIVGDARVVALGESSHGTAEQFRMKHRILRYLVERKSFTVFAIEGGWPEAQAADRFIKSGEGDASAALAAMHFWTWRTEEVRDMLDWMRAYNLARGDRAQISFAGLDCQSADVAVGMVMAYLDRYSTADATTARQLYAGADKLAGLETEGLSGTDKERLKQDAVKVLQLVELRRAGALDDTALKEHRRAVQAARVVVQAAEMVASMAGGVVRDRFMAENVRWLLETEYPREKIVLWAHNSHVATAPVAGARSLGMHLRETYGQQMVVLGFGAHHGTVRAVRMKDGSFKGGPVTLDLAPAISSSIEGLFQDAGLPHFILDFRSLPKDGPLASWLAKPRQYRSIGAGYDPERASDAYESWIVPDRYDGFVFIAESTAAKPLVAPNQSR
jgi:erythromycin esterase